MSSLNPEQRLAVSHDHGPLLILAGAGSGKTTVLVVRTGRLIAEGIAKPENILVLTFTNKAARELKHRVATHIGEKAKGLWAGTFHSFGLSILREFHQQAGLPAYFGVVDQSDAQAILRELLKDIKIAGKDKFDLGALLELIQQRRVRKKEKTEAFDEYHEMAEVLLPKYLKKMEVLGVVDFEGLLLKPLELFAAHPDVLEKIQKRYSQVMVDEFQDTNVSQMKLIDEIAGHHQNLTVVGDDDQSIYGWRGAEVKNILDFPKRYKNCQTVKLERNYRSSPAILEIANQLIVQNKRRHDKILKPESQNLGEKPEIFIFESEQEEADFVAREIQALVSLGLKLEEIAVLYRSNSQGGMIESVLREHRLPYTVSGGTAFFDRREVKDVLAYLRFSLHANDACLRRIINTPSRGIGDTSIEKINHYAGEHRLSFTKACADFRKIDLPEKTKTALAGLFDLQGKLIDKILKGDQPGANLLQALRELGYRDHLYHTSASSETGEKKWQIVEILSRILDSFLPLGKVDLKNLKEFVDAMELRDEREEESPNKISLMTLHASKGLEFPVVFVIGVEEDLLPHKNLGANIDEERRLFYVGLTRAKKKLMLSHCRRRQRHGSMVRVSPSRFLLEIPKASVRIYENGFRPVSSEERQSLVSNFLKSLEKKGH
jgi:superfamily I DNA/RNA helicase